MQKDVHGSPPRMQLYLLPYRRVPRGTAQDSIARENQLDHVVIRREEYVSGTADRPEVGIFTQTHQTRHTVPWGRLAVARSRGESWIVLNSEKLAQEWLSQEGEEREAQVPKRSGRGRSRTLSPALRFQVLRRDGFTCQYCGRTPPEVKLQVDHVVPWSAGGTNQIENIKTACEVCNLGKGAGGLRS